MKHKSNSVKNVIAVGVFLVLFIVLLYLTSEYRQAIRGMSGVRYFNTNPAALLCIIILVGVAVFAILGFQVKEIFDNERRLTEAAIEIRKVTNNLHAGVVNYVLDADGSIVYASHGFYDIIGLTREELHTKYGKSLLRLVSKEYYDFFLRSEDLQKNSYAQKVIKMNGRDGKGFWMQVTLSKATYGGEETISAVFVDVSELKNTQDKLFREQERYRIATELSNELMFEYDYKTDKLVIAEQFSTIYGKNSVIVDFLKNITNNVGIIHADDRKDAMEQIVHTKRIGTNDIQLRMKDANGVYQWCRILYRAICDKNGEPVTAIGKIANISMFKQEIEELERASRVDPLTGAYNKTATKEIINEYIRRHKDSSHMLLMVDVDDFKKVNDNYGHQNGDEVLMYAIRNLRENYTEGEIIGRVGGDEFVVFIGNVENKERLIEKAQNLRDLLQRPYQGDGVLIPVSASLGVSMYPTDGKNYEELMFCADTALYEVKAGKKGNFAIYKKKEQA